MELQPDGTYKLSWLTGIKYIEPVHYWLEEKIVKRWFWFDKKEYYVVCEFCSLGPMSLKEAQYQIAIATNV